MITVITITVFIHIYANILEQCWEKVWSRHHFKEIRLFIEKTLWGNLTHTKIGITLRPYYINLGTLYNNRKVSLHPVFFFSCWKKSDTCRASSYCMHWWEIYAIKVMKCLPNPASQINKKIITQTCPLYTKAELHVTRDMFHFHFTRHLKLLSKLIVHLLYY